MTNKQYIYSITPIIGGWLGGLLLNISIGDKGFFVLISVLATILNIAILFKLTKKHVSTKLINTHRLVTILMAVSATTFYFLL